MSNFDNDFEFSFKDETLTINNMVPNCFIDWSKIYRVELYGLKYDIDDLLSRSSNLEKIIIHFCNLRSIDCLKLNKNLKSLTIEFNGNNLSMSGISDFYKLKSLKISSTKLIEYDGIFDISPLTRIRLTKCGITHITKFINIHLLRELDFFYNNITDISAFEGLPDRVGVSLCYNPVDVRTANLYRIGNNVSIDNELHNLPSSRFENYKKRILLSYKYPLLKIKVRNMWFSFFEQRRDKQSYNRLSYFFSF